MKSTIPEGPLKTLTQNISLSRCMAKRQGSAPHSNTRAPKKHAGARPLIHTLTVMLRMLASIPLSCFISPQAVAGKSNIKGADEMIKLRFAFQGGGAKLVTLLAAAKAVYDLHTDPVCPLEIDKIAGTSAGAIVAGILACEKDPQIVRAYLQKNGLAYESKIFKNQNVLTKAYKLLIRGKALYNYNDLSNFIESLLKITGIDPNQSITETKLNLEIAATDILQQKTCIYPRYSNDATALYKAISDSCSLPFLFKFTNGINSSHILDGGLVENVPIKRISENYDKSRVIAFTFGEPQAPGEIGSARQYISALIDSSIASNVRSSLDLIPESNVISLPNEFSTMDFRAAIEHGLDDHFKYVYNDVKSRLNSIIEREDRLEKQQNNPGTRLSRTINEKRSAYEIYSSLSKSNLRLTEISISIAAESLGTNLNHGHKKFDQIQTTYAIHINNHGVGIFPFKVFITSNTDDIDFSTSDIEAYDSENNPISFTLLAGEFEKIDDTYNFPIYIFFDSKEISPGLNYIYIKHTDLVEHTFPKFMHKMEDGPEKVMMLCQQPAYESVEIRVHLPEEIMAHMKVSQLTENDDIPNGSDIAEGNININFRGDPLCPLNFQTIRWKSCKSVKKNEVAGIVMRKNSNR